MASKVFQIGFNKCGTRTVHRFLQLNGLHAVHWDRGNLARSIYRNLTNRDSLIKGYEQFDAFSDMEYVTSEFAFEAYKLFPLLADEFPDALFLLNTRDREDWVRSRLDHREGAYAKKWKAVLGVDDDARLAELWRTDWDRHHERVTSFFASRHLQFLKFDIANDSPELIARYFPNCRFDLSAYRVKGKGAERQSLPGRVRPTPPVAAAALEPWPAGAD
jgi:hypothetical protein